MNFNQARYIKSIGFHKDIPPPKEKEIVFCGRSNVGKSSLINKLCGRKSLARVSSAPGKTTTINLFFAGDGYFLVDLPGYGYAKRSDGEKRCWGVLMEHYFSSEREFSLVVLLLDIRHDPSADDMRMLDYLRQTGIPFMVVLTKKDKLSKTRQQQSKDRFDVLLKPYRPMDILAFSVNDNEDAEMLRAKIREVAVGEGI